MTRIPGTKLSIILKLGADYFRNHTDPVSLAPQEVLFLSYIVRVSYLKGKIDKQTSDYYLNELENHASDNDPPQ